MRPTVTAPDGRVLAVKLEAQCTPLNGREDVGLSLEYGDFLKRITLHGYGKFGAQLTASQATDLGNTLIQWAKTGRLEASE